MKLSDKFAPLKKTYIRANHSKFVIKELVKWEAISTDLSNAFYCISNDLLTAKLNAYGFHQNALNVIHNYLFGGSQKIKVGSSFSSVILLDILYGAPQGSILGALLFNIHLSDSFLSKYSY